MKKINFYILSIVLGVISGLAVIAFVILFMGFSCNIFMNLNLGALVGFDLFFWTISRILAPMVRNAYDEWQEEIHNNKIDDIEL